MGDFSNDVASSMINLSEKGIEVLGNILSKLYQLIKYISETKERQLNRELKKSEIEKIRQNKDIEEARIYLNQTRGLVKAKYMQNAGKELYPVFQPMSPAELRRFNEHAKTYGLNYYTLQNEAVIEKYNSVIKELKELNKEERQAREKGILEHGSHLDQLRQEYAELQSTMENKTFVTPTDRNRLKSIKKEINDIEENINQNALPLEKQMRKEQLEKELKELEKQRNDVIVVVFKDDLPVVENITERMNMEIDIAEIDRELTDISQKQVLSEEDKQKIADLARQKEDIIRGEFNKYNRNNSQKIVNAALNKEKIINAHQTYNFDDALSRTSNRDYTNAPCYICERNNPDNYIEAKNVQMKNREGENYNNTLFTIYKGEKALDNVYFRRATFDEKQTLSWDENEWKNIKKEIKEQSGLGDELVVFASKEDYMQYKAEYNQAKVEGAEEIKRETEQQMSTMDQKINQEDTIGIEGNTRSYRDYNSIINQLKAQLEDHYMALNEQGAVCYSDTMQEIKISDSMNDDERAKCAEDINIGMRIGVLKQLNDAQTQLAFIDNQQRLNSENFNSNDNSESLRVMYENMRNNLNKQSYEIAVNMTALGSQYARLENDLNYLRSVRIVETIQQQNENVAKDHEKEIDYRTNVVARDFSQAEEREEHSLNKEQWDQAIQNQSSIDISSVSIEPEITMEHE